VKRWTLAMMLLAQCSKPEHAGTGAQPDSLAPSASTAASAPALGADAPSRAASTASPPLATPRASTRQVRIRALRGVAQLQAIIRRRIARGRETEEACLANNRPENPRIETASDEVDEYTGKPPDLQPTAIDGLVADCMDCSGAKGEAVPHECQQAIVALDKLAAELRGAN
jgi:hypothetical protein